MRFHLAILTDNAAFDERPEMEIARLLREAADRIEEAGVLPRSTLSST
jgi:DNA-binding IclR family transcriptional regulator